MTTVGLIVNPVAGLGGAVGLKGTDGAEAAALARRRGAVPRAGERASVALSTLTRRVTGFRLVTAAGEMGAVPAARAGLEPEVVYRPADASRTSPADTVAAVRAMRAAAVILFAGGDGTARDLLEAAGDSILIGIPAGVKMHSAVFAVNARAAAEVTASYLRGHAGVVTAEVLDRVETDARLRTQLFGQLRIPRVPAKVARGKLGSSAPGGDDPAGIAGWLSETRSRGGVDVFGPGTTTAAVLKHLEIDAVPTGVTVVDAGGVLTVDADAQSVERLTGSRPVRIVVSPVGGQGFLLGRGNQQLTPTLLRTVDRSNIVIISHEAKLAALGGAPLLVDTGDDEVDRSLHGYVRVVTGRGRTIMYRIGDR